MLKWQLSPCSHISINHSKTLKSSPQHHPIPVLLDPEQLLALPCTYASVAGSLLFQVFARCIFSHRCSKNTCRQGLFFSFFFLFLASSEHLKSPGWQWGLIAFKQRCPSIPTCKSTWKCMVMWWCSKQDTDPPNPASRCKVAYPFKPGGRPLWKIHHQVSVYYLKNALGNVRKCLDSSPSVAFFPEIPQSCMEIYNKMLLWKVFKWFTKLLTFPDLKRDAWDNVSVSCW